LASLKFMGNTIPGYMTGYLTRRTNHEDLRRAHRMVQSPRPTIPT
jgi:hypothetical protein